MNFILNITEYHQRVVVIHYCKSPQILICGKYVHDNPVLSSAIQYSVDNNSIKYLLDKAKEINVCNGCDFQSYKNELVDCCIFDKNNNLIGKVCEKYSLPVRKNNKTIFQSICIRSINCQEILIKNVRCNNCTLLLNTLKNRKKRGIANQNYRIPRNILNEKYHQLLKEYTLLKEEFQNNQDDLENMKIELKSYEEEDMYVLLKEAIEDKKFEKLQKKSLKYLILDQLFNINQNKNQRR